MAISIELDTAKIWSADVLLSVGAQPNRIVLEGDTTTAINDGPHDLTIAEGSTTLVFSGLKLLSIANRPVRWGRLVGSQYTLEDSRYLWWEKTASPVYNYILHDGSRSAEETCKGIFDYLFGLLGETVDTSAASTALYPSLLYHEPVPIGRVLQDLCEMTHHVICPQIDGTFSVFPRGTGSVVADIPRKSFLQPVGRSVTAFKAVSLPAVYQSLITLVGRAMEADGSLVSLGSVSYLPAAGWAYEWPGNFSGVASGSQYLAMKSVYRVFEAGAAENSQASGTLSLSGATVDIFDTGDALFALDSSAVMVSYVIGSFWPGFHRGDYTTSSSAHYRGEVKVKSNIYHFTDPVFTVEDGLIGQASLKAMSWHHARDVNNNLLVSTSGSGPEVVARWVQPMLIHGVGDNLTDVTSQLAAYAAIWNAEAAIDTYSGVYAGPVELDTNGNIRAVRFKVGYAATSGFIETEAYVGDGWEGLLI